jgi:hypothetical protein
MVNPLAAERRWVEAPASVPYRFGLFTALAPSAPPDGDDAHWRLGVQWQSQACGGARETSGPCVQDAQAAVGIVPDFHVCYVSGFDPFTVYAFNDDTVGAATSLQAHADNARERLAAGEQEAVESHLWGQMRAIESNPVAGTGKSMSYCVGWLEQRLAELYGNQGVIHMNRLAAHLLAGPGGSLVREGNRLTTVLGTTVVAGGGYDETAGALPTSTILYGTGPLAMYRSDVTNTPPVTLDRARNDMSILAQRDYVIGWDCVLVGITAPLA